MEEELFSGSVLIYNRAVSTNGDGNYILHSDEENVDLRLGASRKVGTILNWAINNGGEIYFPCIINNRVPGVADRYNVSLIIPPKISKHNRYFLSGLIIPDVKISHTNPGVGGTGSYILDSEYLGAQQLYSSCDFLLKNSPPNMTFQAKVQFSNKDRGAIKPKVKIVRSMAGLPKIVGENKEFLEDILNARERFWWQ